MPNLSENQIRDIRKRRGAGEGLRGIAETFGISTSLVSNIYRRKRWANVADVVAKVTGCPYLNDTGYRESRQTEFGWVVVYKLKDWQVAAYDGTYGVRLTTLNVRNRTAARDTMKATAEGDVSWIPLLTEAATA